MDEALALLGDGMPGSLGRVVRAIRTDLLRGRSFVEALARHGDVFPADVIALARVSESTGRLDRAIDAATRQRVRTHVLTEKLAGALHYPAFLLVTASIVLVFFLIYVIPQFADVIRDSGSQMDGTIAGIFAASDLLRDHLDLFIAGSAALLVGALAAAQSRALRTAVTKRLSRLPIIRGTGELRRSALFCMNLGTLLGEGVPVPEALKVLENVIGGEAAETLARIGDSVRRGGSLAEALETHAFVPKIARRMLRIGEESGELAEVSARAGILYEKKLEQRLSQIAAFIGPAAIMLISSLIGGLMLTIMSALFSINQLVL
ncbi:type II secretion system F family protein [Methylobacterium sp. Leaf113]|uniref:type II secretion system F family protein n=1 Tax=Methylobacterium sp. Leaf113 TaxID=1736259 RepID=UPI001FCD5FB4|nr:type II secretion system F family protein [Methylobacterium sp. Leaf113]